MNPIELEWQHLKRDEIAGKMFEDELELVHCGVNEITIK
jgi:putative transposase